MTDNDNPIIDEETYVNNYKDYLYLYISAGKPSEETLKAYYIGIDQFIEYCKNKNANPIKMTEYNLLVYQQYLYDKNYKDETILVKMTSIKMFFHAAAKLKIIKINPCLNIKCKPVYLADQQVNYFTTDQLKEICQVFNTEEYEDVVRFRNTAILYLMAVEGLRNIEIRRLNYEDVDWKIGSIIIKNRNHTRTIYPCLETFDKINNYLQVVDDIETSLSPRPLFLSTSNKNLYGRLSTNGIRFIMNKALDVIGYKRKGISCNVFRHSCGANLYEKTKDLSVVQEVLGHKSTVTTLRYAHLQNKISRRTTSLIAPENNN